MLEHWIRWPAAQLFAGRLTLMVVDTNLIPVVEPPQIIPCWIADPGGGRRKSYLFSRYQACWRTFAETLNYDVVLPSVGPGADDMAAFNRERLRLFVRKYGPLSAPEAPSASFGYAVLARRLHTLAAAWDGDAEHSRCSPGAVETAFREAGTALAYWSASSEQLSGKLAATALAHLRLGTAMRRCPACGDWIIRTPNRLYCDGVCRAAALRRRNETTPKD